MPKNKSNVNVQVFNEVTHSDMDDEKALKVIRRLAKKDFKPRTGLAGRNWEGKVVIEFGCGAGLKLLQYGLRGANTIGLDGSPMAITRATRYAALLELEEVAFIECRLEAADEALKDFPKADLVICSGVIHHVHEWREMLSHIANTLKPDGMLYLTWGDWTLHLSGFNIKNQISYRLGWNLQSRMSIGKFLFGWWDKKRNSTNIDWDSFYADLYAAYYIPISRGKMVAELNKNNLRVVSSNPANTIAQVLEQPSVQSSQTRKARWVRRLARYRMIRPLLDFAVTAKWYLLEPTHKPRVISAQRMHLE
jgi:SAM-dependent methyltransferase